MEKTKMMKLELRAPITYAENLSLKHTGTENEEILLCFELNPQESRSIEPDREKFLKDLVFAGKKLPENARREDEKAQISPKEVVLPAGSYLFVQCRGEKPLDREKWLDMAIEQQKDGLWERHKPGNFLYVRFLYEDWAFVTQVFRPLYLPDR